MKKKMASFRLSNTDKQNLADLQSALTDNPTIVVGDVNQTAALSWALQIALREARKPLMLPAGTGVHELKEPAL